MDLPLVTELVRFNYSTLPRGDTVPVHVHHFFQLDVVLEGALTVTLEGVKPFTGRAGDAWLVPPLIRHGFHSTQRYRQGSFKFQLACPWWPSFASGCVRFPLPPNLVLSLEAAGRHEKARQPFAPAGSLAVLTLCLIELLEKVRSPVRQPDHLDPFRRVLWPLLEQTQQTPYAGWTVARMARECHLSVDHFSKCFHRVLGMSPHRYVLETRLRQAAADLLAIPAFPIKAIAQKAGYSTVHAFTRAFKQVFAVGPAAYRRRSRSR